MSFLSKLMFWKSDHPKVSVLRLSGVIASGGGALRKNLNYETLEPVIKKAFADQKQDAVILCINSPGGSPVQSALIGKRIRQLADKNNTPVIAFCEDVAASGGYWLASCADEIYADEASIIGSIGVISAGFGFTQAIAKLGVERRVYTSGESKSMLDPFKNENPKDVKRLKALQTEIHEHFIAHVKSRRGERLNEEEPLFTGSFWTGARAKQLGLIDEIGAMHSVLAQRFGENVKLKQITAKKGLFSLAGSSASMSAAISQELVGEIDQRHHWARFGL
ncbi:MAG: S49 family peptidase [Alphaproteobacteria bacterium]|nr:S49 family peptidase [Alphaproteobacteria bacterium]